MTHAHPFEIRADEPAILLGDDTGANPVETALAGLSGCMTTTLSYKAAALGLNIDSIESEYEGDINVNGFLELDPNCRKGYREVRVKFTVRGDIDAETVKELVKHSPMYDTFTNPVKLVVEVVKV
jgi:uncharacterized OsmC-like protein